MYTDIMIQFVLFVTWVRVRPAIASLSRATVMIRSAAATSAFFPRCGLEECAATPLMVNSSRT